LADLSSVSKTGDLPKKSRRWGKKEIGDEHKVSLCLETLREKKENGGHRFSIGKQRAGRGDQTIRGGYHQKKNPSSLRAEKGLDIVQERRQTES